MTSIQHVESFSYIYGKNRNEVSSYHTAIVLIFLSKSSNLDRLNSACLSVDIFEK